MTDALTTHAATQLVPASYAEKTMASLMQLHGELMEEKERRVDLFRRLMEREQAVAELKMYVKVLEERISPPPPIPMSPPVMTQAVRASPPRVAPQPPPIPPRARVESWKTW